MSLPFYKITCSDCDFHDTYNYEVTYEYSGSKIHEPVLYSAWCGDCNKTVHACMPFTIDDAKEEISELNSWIERQKSGLFAKFSLSKKREIKEAEKEIEEVKERLEYFEKTPYSNICLNCKSENVFPFYLPFDGVKDLKVRHLCGGSLYASVEGRINSSKNHKVIYSENGDILRDSRISLNEGFVTNIDLVNAETHLVNETGITLDNIPDKDPVIEIFESMSIEGNLSNEAQTSLLFRLVVMNHLVALNIMRENGKDTSPDKIVWLTSLLNMSVNWSEKAQDRITLEHLTSQLNMNIKSFLVSFGIKRG